jgi:hypothetical protein
MGCRAENRLGYKCKRSETALKEHLFTLLSLAEEALCIFKINVCYNQ